MESVAEKLRPEGTVTCWHKSRQSPIITKTDDARMNGFFNHSQLSASLGQLSKLQPAWIVRGSQTTPGKETSRDSWASRGRGSSSHK